MFESIYVVPPLLNLKTYGVDTKKPRISLYKSITKNKKECDVSLFRIFLLEGWSNTIFLGITNPKQYELH